MPQRVAPANKRIGRLLSPVLGETVPVAVAAVVPVAAVVVVVVVAVAGAALGVVLYAEGSVLSVPFSTRRVLVFTLYISRIKVPLLSILQCSTVPMAETFISMLLSPEI